MEASLSGLGLVPGPPSTLITYRDVPSVTGVWGLPGPGSWMEDSFYTPYLPRHTQLDTGQVRFGSSDYMSSSWLAQLL